MQEISDEYMRQMLTTVKEYTIVILKAGPKHKEPGARQIVWEHGRRNFVLRAEGLLSIVCPVMDESGITGIGIFDTSIEDTQRLMDGDPGVQAGTFVYDIHPCRSFPGDSLPGEKTVVARG